MRDLNEILSNKHIWGHNIMFPMHTAWIKLPDCGTCSVIWSENEDGIDHPITDYSFDDEHDLILW